MKIINVQNNQGVPKYKQIIFSIEKSIEDEKLKKDDRLPSINKVCLEFSLSRDTVLQAYEELKKRGIIYAILGKGYYVKSTEVRIKQRIFLLFEELNIFKEDLYNSFMENIGKGVQVDIFFHHFNLQVFQKLINDSNGNYTKYIIMPANLVGAAAIIKTLPVKEVYIIPNDRDLVQVIEKAKLQDLKLGSDFGIISYNETPLKKVVENGITTISTDFRAMGKILAQMILSGNKEQIENKCALIIRNSL